MSYKKSSQRWDKCCENVHLLTTTGRQNAPYEMAIYKTYVGESNLLEERKSRKIILKLDKCLQGAAFKMRCSYA